MQLEIPHQAVFPAHNLDFFGCRLELFRAISLFDISVDDNAEIAVAKAEYSSMIAIVCDDNCSLALFFSSSQYNEVEAITVYRMTYNIYKQYTSIHDICGFCFVIE